MESVELENRDLCSKCGGDCCKKSGCDYFPEDFSSLETKALLEILKEGNISIVSLLRFEQLNDGRLVAVPLLYLRARNKDRDVVDLVSLKKPCSMLKENGCSYDLEHRPSGGVNFIPQPDRKCYPNIAPDEVVRKWERYQRPLERIVKRITGMSVEAKLSEDVETLISDVIQGDFCDVHPNELVDVYDMLPVLIKAFPAEAVSACAKSGIADPVAKMRKIGQKKI